MVNVTEVIYHGLAGNNIQKICKTSAEMGVQNRKSAILWNILLIKCVVTFHMYLKGRNCRGKNMSYTRVGTIDLRENTWVYSTFRLG